MRDFETLKWIERARGFVLTYADLGPRDGRPIMFVHGLSASGLQFVADAEHFAALGYRVLVPNLRGHGASLAPPAYETTDFSMEKMSGDLIALLDAEQIERVDWIGNSLGGILGLRLMPDFNARINSFTTFGTSYTLDVPRLSVPFGRASWNLIGREQAALWGARLTTQTEEGRRILAEILETLDVEVVAIVGDFVRRYDFRTRAQSYSGPILMIRGGRDYAVNLALGSSIEAMQDKANFTLVDIPEAGHCANLDAPHKVRTILLDFLSSTA